MWRLTLLLFLALPPLAILLNHDLASTVLIVAWTAFVVPVGILQAIDFYRRNHGTADRMRRLAVYVLKLPIGLLGLLSLLMGIAMIAWCLYNVLIRRLPGYSGPTDVVRLVAEGFGIAPMLGAFGWYLLRLAAGRIDDTGPAGEVHDGADADTPVARVSR